MKTAVFCSKPINPFIIFALLPDNVEAVFSSVGFDFGAGDVARFFKCPYERFDTADEAILKADFIYVIWDGSDTDILKISKKSKSQGKYTVFSYLP